MVVILIAISIVPKSCGPGDGVRTLDRQKEPLYILPVRSGHKLLSHNNGVEIVASGKDVGGIAHLPHVPIREVQLRQALAAIVHPAGVSDIGHVKAADINVGQRTAVLIHGRCAPGAGGNEIVTHNNALQRGIARVSELWLMSKLLMSISSMELHPSNIATISAQEDVLSVLRLTDTRDEQL